MDQRFAPPTVGVADPAGPAGPRPAWLFFATGAGVGVLGLVSLVIGLFGFHRMEPGNEMDLVMSSLCSVYGLAMLGAAVGLFQRRLWAAWLGGVLLLLVTGFLHIGMSFEPGDTEAGTDTVMVVSALLWVVLLGAVGCIVQAMRHARASR